MPKGPLTIAEQATGGATDGPHTLEATRRRLTPRQAEVVMQLVQATGEEVEEVGYAGLTVRTVARRAGVAPATAYNYFSSKDHLLAEVLWRRMQALPTRRGRTGTARCAERLADAVRSMVLFTTESPALVDACTVALLSPNPDVKHLRDRIGAADPPPAGRGPRPGVDPLVVRVLRDLLLGLAADRRAWATCPTRTSPTSWSPRPSCCSIGRRWPPSRERLG